MSSLENDADDLRAQLMREWSDKQAAEAASRARSVADYDEICRWIDPLVSEFQAVLRRRGSPDSIEYGKREGWHVSFMADIYDRKGVLVFASVASHGVLVSAGWKWQTYFVPDMDAIYGSVGKIAVRDALAAGKSLTELDKGLEWLSKWLRSNVTPEEIRACFVKGLENTLR